MTLLLSLDHDGRVYYTLTCTQCSVPYTCFDDACYNYESLRAEAIFAGWDVAARPEQPHYCPPCARSHDLATNRPRGDSRPHTTHKRAMPGR